jgi:endonuclease/exonuclease/phosphatase family metal-dependent hydrolase
MKEEREKTISVLCVNTWVEKKELLERLHILTEKVGSALQQSPRHRQFQSTQEEDSAHSPVYQQVLEEKPDIVCMQEAATPVTRACIGRALHKDYHIVAAHHTHPSFPPIAYTFSLIPLSMLLLKSVIVWFLGRGTPTSGLLGWVSNLVVSFVPVSTSFSWIALLLWTLLFLLLLPQTILRLVKTLGMKSSDALLQQLRARYSCSAIDNLIDFCFMGTLILARRDRIAAIETLQITPFPASFRGYEKPWAATPLPSQQPPPLLSQRVKAFLGRCAFFWFQMSFLRPGYMIARCVLKQQQRALQQEQPHSQEDAAAASSSDSRIDCNNEFFVVNCHLVVGLSNPARAGQVKHVLDSLDALRRSRSHRRHHHHHHRNEPAAREPDPSAAVVSTSVDTLFLDDSSSVRRRVGQSNKRSVDESSSSRKQVEAKSLGWQQQQQHQEQEFSPPVIWCGDFNAHHDEPEFVHLRDAGFVDAAEAAHPHFRSLPLRHVCTWDNANPHGAPGVFVHAFFRTICRRQSLRCD